MEEERHSELQAAIWDALDHRGVLARMKAELRKEVFMVADGMPPVKQNVPPLLRDGDAITQLSLELVVDFLQQYEMKSTLNVLFSESGLRDMPGRDQLRSMMSPIISDDVAERSNEADDMSVLEDMCYTALNRSSSRSPDQSDVRNDFVTTRTQVNERLPQLPITMLDTAPNPSLSVGMAAIENQLNALDIRTGMKERGVASNDGADEVDDDEGSFELCSSDEVEDPDDGSGEAIDDEDDNHASIYEPVDETELYRKRKGDPGIYSDDPSADDSELEKYDMQTVKRT